MANGSQSPAELLGLVVEHTRLRHNHLPPGDVCPSWRPAAATGRPHAHVTHLMAPIRGQDSPLFTSAFELIHRTKIIPQGPLRRCCTGCSHGYLAFADAESHVWLLNPQSGAQLELPPLTSLEPPMQMQQRDRNLWKACLSSPDPEDCTVMVIDDKPFGLAYARPGDDAWTAVASAWESYQDVVHYNGVFYAVSTTGSITGISITESSIDVVSIAPPPYECCTGVRSLVVLPSEGLVQVVKTYDGGTRGERNISIKIFQVVLYGGRLRWVEIDSLGDWALFVGNTCALALPSSEVCSANCIYFTHECMELDLEYKRFISSSAQSHTGKAMIRRREQNDGFEDDPIVKIPLERIWNDAFRRYKSCRTLWVRRKKTGQSAVEDDSSDESVASNSVDSYCTTENGTVFASDRDCTSRNEAIVTRSGPRKAAEKEEARKKVRT